MSKPLMENSDIRWFPIIIDGMVRPRNNKIPWTLAEVVYEGYSQRYGTDQSLERLAERGGFGIIEIADHLGDTIADLRAENARLQERLDTQEPWLAALGRMLVQHRIVQFPDVVLAWRDERDGYKARDKLRGEALEAGLRAAPQPQATRRGVTETGQRISAWKELARAAIDISPEEAREKERG